MLLYFVKPTPKMQPGQNRWLKALDVDNGYRESSMFWNTWRSGHEVKPLPPPQSFLKWWWPFISWYSESIQKRSFELLCWAHFPGVPHIFFPGHRPTSDSSRMSLGPVCLKRSVNSGFAFQDRPPWAELSFQPIGGLYSENSPGPGIRVQDPILPLHLPASLQEVPETVTAGFPH